MITNLRLDVVVNIFKHMEICCTSDHLIDENQSFCLTDFDGKLGAVWVNPILKCSLYLLHDDK